MLAPWSRRWRPRSSGSPSSTTRRPRSADVPVTISRTGFTGDLGYEIFADAADAETLWDTVVEAGQPHGILPFGQTALLMARIEAGLLLVGVDFEPSRLAENDEHRSTPDELGLGWMLRGSTTTGRSSAVTRSDASVATARHAGR